jgi:hypothetical protein
MAYTIEDDIGAYETMRADLESRLMGKWVLIREKSLVGAYESFDLAASDAVAKFGRGPYLIRQVGAPPVVLPASVVYRLVNA